MEKHRCMRYCFYTVILAVLTLAVTKKIYDYDIWYHLVIGRKIFETMHIPATEFFVYPQLGDPVSFHEWGFGLFFYLAYRWFGYWGMGLANAMLGGISLFLFYLSTESGGRRNYSAALLLVPLFLLVDFRLMYRPEMFFFLFLGVEVYLLERFGQDGRWRWLYLLPLLTFLLNNVHPSAFFLLAVLGAYSLQFLLDAIRQQKLRYSFAGKLLGVFAAAVLSSALNPYGFQQTLLPLNFVQSSEYLQQVVEFVPTFQTPLKLQFIIIAASGILALIFQPRRRIVDWFLLILFGYLGFRYARNVALFALIAYVPVSRTLGTLADGFHLFQTPAREKMASLVVLAAMVALLATMAMSETWGTGPLSCRFPEQATRSITALKPPGRLFNSYASGGYFGWELYDKYLVAIDGRHYSMDKSFIQNKQVFEAKPGWQKVLTDYEVTTIFTPATSPFTGVLVDLLPCLDADEGWMLVSAEPSGLLFMRREVVPLMQGKQMPDQNLIWRQVIKEAELIPVAPEHADAYLSMSIAYFNLHNLSQAVAYLKKYTQLTPGDLVAAKNLALLEHGGRFDATTAPASTKYRIF